MSDQELRQFEAELWENIFDMATNTNITPSEIIRVLERIIRSVRRLANLRDQPAD